MYWDVLREKIDFSPTKTHPDGTMTVLINKWQRGVDFPQNGSSFHVYYRYDRM